MALQTDAKARQRDLKRRLLSCLMLVLQPPISHGAVDPLSQKMTTLTPFARLGCRVKSDLPELYLDAQVHGKFEKKRPNGLLGAGIPLSENLSFQMQCDFSQPIGKAWFTNGMDIGVGYRGEIYRQVLVGASASTGLNVSSGSVKLQGLDVSFEALLQNLRLAAAFHGASLEHFSDALSAPDRNRFKAEISGHILKPLVGSWRILDQTSIDCDIHSVSFKSTRNCEKAFLGAQFDTGIKLLGLRLNMGGQFDLRQVWTKQQSFRESLGFRVFLSNHRSLIHRFNTSAELKQAKYGTFLKTEKKAVRLVDVQAPRKAKQLTLQRFQKIHAVPLIRLSELGSENQNSEIQLTGFNQGQISQKRITEGWCDSLNSVRQDRPLLENNLLIYPGSFAKKDLEIKQLNQKIEEIGQQNRQKEQELYELSQQNHRYHKAAKALQETIQAFQKESAALKKERGKQAAQIEQLEAMRASQQLTITKLMREIAKLQREILERTRLEQRLCKLVTLFSVKVKEDGLALQRYDLIQQEKTQAWQSHQALSAGYASRCSIAEQNPTTLDETPRTLLDAEGTPRTLFTGNDSSDLDQIVDQKKQAGCDRKESLAERLRLNLTLVNGERLLQERGFIENNQTWREESCRSDFSSSEPRTPPTCSTTDPTLARRLSCPPTCRNSDNEEELLSYRVTDSDKRMA